MGKKTQRSIGLALATLTGTAILAAGASPASAASTACAIQQQTCSTGTVSAGADRAVTVTAQPGWGRVTCRVHDAYNGIQVGSVSANFWTDYEAKSRTIGGLNGLYFAVCQRYSGSGGGGSLR